MDFNEIVKKCFAAYLEKDREMIEDLLCDDFTFSSPDDPLLDRKAYFEKCWPFNQQVKNFSIEKLINNGNEGFVRYECETMAGRRFRNTEFFTVKDGKILRVEVYYGILLHE